MIAVIPGGGGLTFVTKKVTLSSGAATVNHGLNKFVVVGAVPYHASAIPDDEIGVLGAPDDEGFISGGSGGTASMKSNNGSSSGTWLVTFAGY